MSWVALLTTAHISIVFHNLSGYDSHLFIKEIGKRVSKNHIGVIAENKEKYISFNLRSNVKLGGVGNEDGREACKNIQLRFINSCRFMVLSLDELAYLTWLMISVSTLWSFKRKRKFLGLEGARVCTHRSIWIAGKN